MIIYLFIEWGVFFNFYIYKISSKGFELFGCTGWMGGVSECCVGRIA